MSKERLERVAAAVLVLLAVFLCFPFQFEIKGAVLTLPILLIMILAGLTLYRIIVFKEKPDFSGMYLIPFLVFLLCSIPGRIPHLRVNGWLQGTWHLFRNLVELLPIMYVLVVLNVKKRSRVRLLVLVVLISVSLSAAIGIMQTASDGRLLTGIGEHGNLKYLGVFPPVPPESLPLAEAHIGRISIITHTLHTDMYRAHGGLSLHNHFGAFQTLALALMLSLALFTRKPVFLLMTGLQFAGLAVTFTRAAWIAGFVFVMIILLLRKRLARDLRLLALVLVLAGTCLTVIRPSVSQAVFFRGLTIIRSPVEPSQEVEARPRIWASAMQIMLKSPSVLIFGRGFGGIDKFDILGVSLSAHNDVIDTLYTRGLIAFVGLAGFYFLILRGSYRLFHEEQNDRSQALALGVFSGLIGMCIVGISQTMNNVPEVAGLIWFVIALFIAYKRSPRENPE